MSEGDEEVHKYGGNTRLSKGITVDEREKLALMVKEKKRANLKELQRNYAGIWKVHEITDTEKVDIEGMLQTAAKKLDGLGISKGRELLPSLQEISIIVFRSQSLGRRADTSELGEHINYYVRPEWEGQPLDGKAFYHEIYHFVANKIVKADRDSPVRYFKAASQGITPISHRESQGMPFEGMAEIFAFYCLEQPMDSTPSLFKDLPIQEVAYISEFSFDIALIERYAKIVGIKTNRAIKDFLKHHIEGDYSFYKDLVDAFGLTAIHEINNMGEDHTKMIDAAGEGGFVHDFEAIENKLNDGKYIHVPGLDIQVRKRIPPERPEPSKLRKTLMWWGYLFDIGLLKKL